MNMLGTKKVDGGRNTGPGRWVQEIAWRDFYVNVLAAFPRVSMGRPFLEKFDDVVWEKDEEGLQKWKDGKTGIPIVDAAMRCLNETGWMHNRMRMIVAMFLVKDLMIDWRRGEQVSITIVLRAVLQLTDPFI
jgi:deoxyribodipyrimidine photo-lyase